MFGNPWLPTPCSAQLFRERSSNSEDCPWIWTFCRQQLFWWPSTSKIEQLVDDFLEDFQMCSSHPNTNRTPDLKTCYFMKTNEKHTQTQPTIVGGLDARGNGCWHRCVVCVWAMTGGASMFAHSPSKFIASAKAPHQRCFTRQILRPPPGNTNRTQIALPLPLARHC